MEILSNLQLRNVLTIESWYRKQYEEYVFGRVNNQQCTITWKETFGKNPSKGGPGFSRKEINIITSCNNYPLRE